MWTDGDGEMPDRDEVGRWIVGYQEDTAECRQSGLRVQLDVWCVE